MLYHGTNTQSLLRAFEVDELRPARTDVVAGVKEILGSYVVADKITDELAKTVLAQGGTALVPTIAQQAHADRKGGIFFFTDSSYLISYTDSKFAHPSFSNPAPFVSTFVEDGGEFAYGVRKALEKATGLTIEPRFKGAKPVVLEVDLDESKLNMGSTHLERVYQGLLDIDKIQGVMVLNSQGGIDKYMSAPDARVFCKLHAEATQTEKPLLSHLGRLEKDSTEPVKVTSARQAASHSQFSHSKNAPVSLRR